MAKDKTNNLDFKIPKGWKYIPFGDVFEFIPTIALSREQLTLENSKNNIYNIHYGDIHATYNANILDFDKEIRIPRINVEIEIKSTTLLKDGDLAIADASEDYEGVGSSIELSNVDGKKATGGLHTFIARDLSGLTEKGFRNYVLKNPIVSIELKKLATGSKVYGISKTNLASLSILLPTVQEQRRIAKIFHSWDESIEIIETIIQRKERNKKALMQKLLSGKKRFKEFKGEKLKEFTLSKVAKLVRGPFGGSLKKEIFVENGFKVYEQKNAIYDNFELGSYYITEEKYKELIRFKVEPGDVIMSCSGTAGKFAIAPVNTKPGIINQALLKITVNPQLLINDYFKQFVKSPVFNNQLFMDFAGGAIKNIGSVGSLSKITLKVPSIKEQKRVASVLSAIDEEIQTLKMQLEHCKQQKRGLMQVLLTGKKRVKI